MQKIIASVFFTGLFFCSIVCAHAPLIAAKKTNYQPDLPPISFATLTAHQIQVEAYGKKRFRVVIPANDIINLAITRNKNPVLSELIPGSYLRSFVKFRSKNNFHDTPIDAQIITHNTIQSIKITDFNISPQNITLIIKPFSQERKITAENGPGAIVVNSSCIKNRVACGLGCAYMIVPDLECRNKLGIL